MKRSLWSIACVALVFLMVSLGSARAGRVLKNAEYYVGLAEKYASEGTTSVLPDTIRSAEELLDQAAPEELQDPKYAELRERLAKVKGAGAPAAPATAPAPATAAPAPEESAAEAPATAPAPATAAPVPSVVALNPNIVRWAGKGLADAETILANKTALTPDEESKVIAFLDQARGQLDQATDSEKSSAAYIELQGRYDKAQARLTELVAARPAPLVTPAGRSRQMVEPTATAGRSRGEDTAAPAGGPAVDEQKLIEEVENLEQAYRQAMATIESAGVSPDLQSMEAYDAVVAPSRRQMEKIKADFDAFLASHPETQDAQGHRDVWMAVQYAKRLSRPCDDRWFQQQRTTAQNLTQNRQEQERRLKEDQERKAAWEKTSVLKGDRLRIYQERGIPQFWEGFFESKGMPEEAARASAWTYFNSWYREATGVGMRQDVTIFHFEGDRLIRTEEKTNRSD
jgi:hypothetical protein